MTTVDSNPEDTHAIVKGAGINFAGSLSVIISVAFLALLGRCFGPVITGGFLLSRALIDMISKLAVCGLDRSTLTRAAGHQARQDTDAFYRHILDALFIGGLSGIFVTTITFFFAPFICNSYLHHPEWTLAFRVMSLSILFWPVSAIFLFATRALRFMHYEVITKRAVEPAFQFVLALLFFFLGFGITGLAMAFTAAAMAGACFSIYFFSLVGSFAKLSEALQIPTDASNLFGHALPIGLYDLGNLFLQRLDLILVASLLPGVTMGYYAMAQEIAFAVKRIRQSFDPILLPVLSGSHASQKTNDMRVQYQNVTRWILFLDLFVLGIFLFTGKSLLGIFGPFQEGYPVLILLTLSVLINGVLGVSELFLLIKHPYINCMNTVCTIGVCAVCLFFGIKLFALAGAAAAIVLSYLFMNTCRILEVRHLFGLHPFTTCHGKGLFVFFTALFVAGCLQILPGSKVWLDLLSALLFVLLFLILLFKFSMTEMDHHLLKKLFKKLKIVTNET